MRCWECDSGTGWLRSTRAMAPWLSRRPLASACSTRAAKVPRRLASNSARRGSSISKAWRLRETIWVASREWPPSSKKSSSRPTWATPSTSRQMAARRCSTSVCGATCSRWRHCGSGRALRSSLPAGDSGIASRRSRCAGTM
ncbi:hypothetical protein D3C80_890650 [compost metagenome]